MSTRRKKYSRQAKNKAERYGTSDSDTPVQDTEHQQTMRIITRLSQKYLTTRATPGSTSQSSAFTAGQLSVSCKQTKQNRKAPFTFQKAGSVKETTAKNKHKNS
ncbi:uncharacterized protein LOC135468836 isoform X2 [Liolophura sinensis]|uniref:uncharacterized protein LOC135468836 isoform X2 n=1 Tax=Liolophura sinensis TaxID=3198878 RepID=UPI003158286C